MRPHTAHFNFLAMLFVLFACQAPLQADEVKDLIAEILAASPNERAKLSTYQRNNKAPKGNSSNRAKSRPKQGSLTPDLGIPESQLLEVSSKFPADVVGKFVYGPVTFKAVRDTDGETYIHLTSKNGRGFILYTSDPAIIQAFGSSWWGTRFVIPKECPLRVVEKDFLPGYYVVRTAYDKSNRSYTLREHLANHPFSGPEQQRARPSTDPFEGIR